MGKISMNSGTTLVSVDKVLPPKVLVIPMKSRPVFPGIFMPLIIEGEKYKRTVDKALETDGFVGLILMTNPEIEDVDEGSLREVGTVGKIVKKINLPDGKMNIFINTLKRFVVKKYLSFNPYITAAIKDVEEPVKMDNEIKALVRALYSEIKEVSEDNPFFTEEIKLNMANLDGAEKVADFVASILNIDSEEQQRILEIFDVKKRIEKVLTLLHKEKELLKLQKKIQDQNTEKVKLMFDATKRT